MDQKRGLQTTTENAAGTFLFVFGDNTCHYSLQ